MQERNELNDIILNRNNNSIGSNKKIVLAVGVLAVILIVVVMIMKGSVSNSADNLPQAQQAAKTNLPPQSPNVQSSDENQGDAPLFQPVEIVKENQKGDDELDKIAQKLKQESLSKEQTPVEAPAVAQQEEKKPTIPVEKQTAPLTKHQNVAKQEPILKTEKIAKKESVKRKSIGVKTEPAAKKESLARKDSLFKKESAPKKESLFKKEEKTLVKATTPSKATTPTYYVQVGSFTKNTPSEKYFSSIKNLGYNYESPKVGDVNKIMVGPFKNEADAREALKSLRKNVESGAFITKK